MREKKGERRYEGEDEDGDRREKEGDCLGSFDFTVPILVLSYHETLIYFICLGLRGWCHVLEL